MNGGIRGGERWMLAWVLAWTLAFAIVLTPLPSYARNSILLDAETTHLLRTYANPLIRTAGLQPHNIDVYLQATDQVNAYASPGRIVLFSGLVLRTQTPEELQAIIAHEIAHIASGHIPTLVRQRKNAGLLAAATQIIGLGAIIAGLAPLGALVLASGSSLATYSALGQTRVAEASADQAALSYLDSTGVSGKGLISFFRREFLPKEQAYAVAANAALNPYTRTHPLSADRMRYLETRVRRAQNYDKDTPEALQFAHTLILAKLYGFTKSPTATLGRYGDDSLPSRYARAVMFAYHLGDAQSSLLLIDSMIAEKPNHPYFYELKGYILSRGGNFKAAVKNYRRALALAPYNLIMRLEIGNVLVRSQDPTLIKQGITHLRLASQDRSLASSTYRPIARGFGTLGKIGRAELATAEALIAEGNPAAARRHAERALSKLSVNDKISRLRAQDILSILGDKKK